MDKENEVMQVPYIVYESAEAKHERTVKRLILALMLAIGLLFLSNALWLNAWMQYDYVSETESVEYKQDGEGYNNINVGTQGDVTNGAELQKNNEEENKDKEIK